MFRPFNILFAVAWVATWVTAHAADENRTAGDALQFVLPAVALGATAFHRDSTGAVEFAEASVTALAVTYALKYSVNERRPDGGTQSFPSGHSSISFSSAEFLRKRYGWEYGLPAYATATFVAYSRVESHEHYPHDVIAGAAIGIASSYLFTKPYHGWMIEPDAGKKYCGIQLSRSF